MMLNTPTFKSFCSQGAGNFEYRIYSDLSQIAALDSYWANLLRESACHPAFGSIEWYLASCRIHSSLVPYLVVGSRGSELHSVLPLALDPQSGLATFPHYANDYNDVLIRSDNSVEVASLLKYAISPEHPCRRLALSKLRSDSDCIRAAACVKDEPGIFYQYEDIDSYSYVDLPSNFDHYLDSLGRKFRKNTRRALRAVEANALAIRELHPDNCSPVDLPEIFLRLFMSRHTGKSFFQDTQAQWFTREILPIMFRKGHLRVFAMFEAGKIIAIVLFFVSNKGLLAWNAGFLTDKADWSPGTSVYAFAIKQAISEGMRELDFGEGDEAYKSNWTKNSYRVGKLVVERR